MSIRARIFAVIGLVVAAAFGQTLFVVSLEQQRTRLRTAQDAASISVSVDHGVTFQKLWSATETGSVKAEVDLMPAILAAVKTYATLGEIADVLRVVFGTHRETVVL